MARENCVIVSQVKGLCHSNRSFIGLKLIAQCEKRIALIFVTYLRLSFSNHDEIRCYWYVPPTAWFQLWSVSLQRRVIAAAGGANLSGHRNTENLHRWPHLLSNLGYRADWLVLVLIPLVLVLWGVCSFVDVTYIRVSCSWGWSYPGSWYVSDGRRDRLRQELWKRFVTLLQAFSVAEPVLQPIPKMSQVSLNSMSIFILYFFV